MPGSAAAAPTAIGRLDEVLGHFEDVSRLRPGTTLGRTRDRTPRAPHRAASRPRDEIRSRQRVRRGSWVVSTGSGPAAASACNQTNPAAPPGACLVTSPWPSAARISPGHVDQLAANLAPPPAGRSRRPSAAGSPPVRDICALRRSATRRRSAPSGARPGNLSASSESIGSNAPKRALIRSFARRLVAWTVTGRYNPLYLCRMVVLRHERHSPIIHALSIRIKPSENTHDTTDATRFVAADPVGAHSAMIPDLRTERTHSDAPRRSSISAAPRSAQRELTTLHHHISRPVQLDRRRRARLLIFSVTSSHGHGRWDSGPSKPRRACASCEQIRTEAPASLLLTTDSLRQTAPSARHTEPRTGRHHGDEGSDLAVKSIVSLRHTVTQRPPFRTSKACPTSIHSLIPAPFLRVHSTARFPSTLKIAHPCTIPHATSASRVDRV